MEVEIAYISQLIKRFVIFFVNFLSPKITIKGIIMPNVESNTIVFPCGRNPSILSRRYINSNTTITRKPHAHIFLAILTVISFAERLMGTHCESWFVAVFIS